MTMKRLLTILVGILVLSGFAGTLYYLYSKSEEPLETFETDSPYVTTIVKKTVATGSVVPRKEVEIKPQVSGIVAKLHVEPGQHVAAGDLIARIRIIPDMINLSSAQNRLNVARINMENAEIELSRNRRLRDEGVISATDFQQVELAYDNAREELTAAEDHLELIRLGSTKKTGETSNTLVRATIDGTVLEVPLEEGDSVIESNTFNEGTTIATVADMDELIFEGKVDESEVGKLRPGMDLMLTIGAIEGEEFNAELEHIAPKGIEENGAIQFEIRAALALGAGSLIRANYSANADIVLDRRDEVLAVNEALLQFDGETPYVEVETAPQSFERRDVELGLSDGVAIEVLAGLRDDDRIKVVR
jgi:HlyD family secretion protein